MKILKWILTLCIVFILLCILALGLFFISPGIQKSLLLGALKRTVENPSVESVRLTPNSLSVENLAFTSGGHSLQLGRMELDFPLTQLAFKRRLQVNELTLEGLNLRVVESITPAYERVTAPPPRTDPAPRPATPSAPGDTTRPKTDPGKTVDFDGIFSKVTLPAQVAIARLAIDGRYDDPAAARTVTFKISGRDIGAGHSGHLEVDADATAADETELAVHFSGTWETQPGGALKSIHSELEVKALKAPGLLEPQSLGASIQAEIGTDGSERFSTELRKAGADHPLLQAQFQFKPDLSEWRTSGTLAIDHNDVAPFALGWDFPDFSASGQWTAGLESGSSDGTAKATFQAEVSGWEKINAMLHGLQPIELKLAFEGDSESADVLRVRHFQAEAAMQAQAPFMALAVPSPITLRIVDGKLEAEPETAPLAEISLLNLPMQVVHLMLPDWSLDARRTHGVWQLFAKEQGSFRLDNPTPLELGGFSLGHDGADWFNHIDLVAEISAVKTPTAFNLQVRQLNLTTADRSLLGGQLHFQQADTSPTLDFQLQADVAALLEQPMFSEFGNARSAQMNLKGKLLLEDVLRFESELLLNHWYSKNRPQGVERVQIQLTGSRDQQGVLTVQAPAEMRGSAGNSTFKTAATLRAADEDTMALKGGITGESLYLDDLLNLLALFEKTPQMLIDSPSDAVATRPLPQTLPHTPATTPESAPYNGETFQPGPVWQGYEGALSLNLTKLIYGDYILDDFSASLAIEADKIVLSPVTARFHNAPLNLDATLLFDSAQSADKPYHLQGTTGLKDFDAGAYLARNRHGPPPFEGSFNFDGSFESRALEPAGLGEALQGDFRLSGGPGKLRMLAAGGETVQATAQLAGGILGVASMLGGSVIKELPALEQLVQLLQEVNYSKLDFHAVRGPTLNVDIQQLLLQAEEIRLAGSGVIRYREGVGFSSLPMSIGTELDASGKAADLLRQMRLLKFDETTPDGFVRGPRFMITGTPASPDFNELTNLLADAGRALAQGLIGQRLGLERATGESGETPPQSPIRETERAVRDIFQRFVPPPAENKAE